MTAYLAQAFNTQFFDGATVAADYALYITDSGTSWPGGAKTVYKNQAGTVAHTNPIILDANGCVPGGMMWITSGECTASLYTDLIEDGGALKWTRDDIGGAASSGDVATLRADLVDRTSDTKGAGMVGLMGRTVRDALLEVVNVLNYGADATGAADSTEAFNDMDAYLQAITSVPVKVVLPAGRYKVNPKNTTNPFGGSQARLFGLYSDGSTVEGPGEIVIDSSVSYTAGLSAGDEKYWSVVQVNANDCWVSGVGFDGNGTNTASGYNPAVVNIRWQLVASFGTSGNHRSGNKVVFCHGKDFGGQAVAFQYQDDPCILYNKFKNHTGMGVSVGTNALIHGNASRDCYDAPIYVNGNVFGAKVTENYVKGTSNGSACDIVGAFDVEVSQNHFEGAHGAGILVSWSGQQSVASGRVHIHHNTLKGNARYSGAPAVAEILVGDISTSRANNATTVHIEHNTIIVDGSLGASAGQALRLGYGTHDVSFCDNEIYGTANAGNILVTASQNLDGFEIRRNKWLGSTTRQIISLGTGLTHTNVRSSENRMLGMDPAATIFPNAGIEAPDGSLDYGSQRDVGTTPVNVLTITWAGGIDQAIILVDVSQAGDRGAAMQRIVARGSSGASTTILENASVSSFGTSPPVIAVDTATLGVLKVTVASGTGTNNTSIGIKVRARKEPGPTVVFA